MAGGRLPRKIEFEEIGSAELGKVSRLVPQTERRRAVDRRQASPSRRMALPSPGFSATKRPSARGARIFAFMSACLGSGAAARPARARLRKRERGLSALQPMRALIPVMRPPALAKRFPRPPARLEGRAAEGPERGGQTVQALGARHQLL